VGLSVTMVAAVTSTATTTAPVEEGGDKPRVMAPTPGCSDCLVATMAATVGGGGDARLLERMRLGSGSLVSKTSWEEEEEVTADVTVDTTQDTTKDPTQDTTQDTTKDPTQDSTQDTTNTLRMATATPATASSSRASVSVTTS